MNKNTTKTATAPLTAREMFRAEYGDSRNFMTPDVIYRRLIGENVAVELSTGEGLRGDTVFGVTFVSRNPRTGETRRSYVASGLRHTREDAETYIRRVERTLARVSR